MHTLIATRADMPPVRLYERIRQRPPRSCENNVAPTLDPFNEGIPSSYRVHIWYGKTTKAGLQSGEGCMMIHSVIWAEYINMTDTRTATQPRRDSNCCPNALRTGGKNGPRRMNSTVLAI